MKAASSTVSPRLNGGLKHSRTNSSNSYDAVSLGSWGAGTVLTTATVNLIPDPSHPGKFYCPKHPGSLADAATDACAICEQEFQQHTSFLQQRRDIVSQQLADLPNLVQELDVNNGQGENSPYNTATNNNAATTPGAPAMPGDGGTPMPGGVSSSAGASPPMPSPMHSTSQQMPGASPPSMSQQQPSAMPPSMNGMNGMSSVAPPFATATAALYGGGMPPQQQHPMYGNGPAPPQYPAAYYHHNGFHPPPQQQHHHPDVMTMQLQRMQQMQDWMLLQKEKECTALRERYEEAVNVIQQLRVENALLTERFHQQEQQMQQDLKLIKMAAVQKQQQRKLAEQQQVRSLVVARNRYDEEEETDYDDDEDDQYSRRNYEEEQQSVMDIPPPAWKSPEFDNHSNVLAGMSSVELVDEPPDETTHSSHHRHQEVPKHLVADGKGGVPLEETISLGTMPRQQQAAAAGNNFTYSEADETLVDHHEEPTIHEEQESLDDQPTEEQQSVEHQQEPESNAIDGDDDDNTNTESGTNGVQTQANRAAEGNATQSTEAETWSFDGSYDVTPKMSSMKKSFLPPKPPITMPNHNPRGVTWTDDNASVGQSIASSTFGEDRQTVNSQIIMDPYGDKGVYSGVILRSTGMPHGSGEMRYQEDNRTYDGEWRHGRWHGHGKATFANGDSYVGEYRYDQSMFQEDKRHGTGKFSWPDGAEYDGEFCNGQREGNGVYKFSDGGRYEGSWKDGRYSGFGICAWEDGRCYKGYAYHTAQSFLLTILFSEWLNGMAHGKGVETFPDGTIRHDGQWVEDEPVPN